MLLLTSVVFSEPGFDDQGNPNNPIVNERANACYEGGTLQFQCETEHHWQVGWYLIRFQFGLVGRDVFPDWAVWALPDKPAVNVTPVFTPVFTPVSTATPENFCALAWQPNYYVDFTLSNFVNSGNYWSDPDCTVPNGSLSRQWVYSPSGQANATTICIANLGAGYMAVPSQGPLVFECVL